MENKEYNGWTNYETWLFKLWLDNEEPTYNLTREVAKSSKNIYSLSKELEDMGDQMATEALGTENNNGFIVDLVNAGLREVNYYDIAESLMQEIK